MIRVGIYLYDEVEVLDFAGPFEVFSTAARLHRRDHPGDEPLFEVSTIGEFQRGIQARGGLVVQPRFAFGEHPAFDVVVIPGGVVTAELVKPLVLGWIAAQAALAQIVASVCTGAFLLGKAGLLKGRRVTTHWEDVDELRSFQKDAQVEGGVRWIDEDSIVTSAGISAGLDMGLHLVERLAGPELALRTARQMDYEWTGRS
jgi:transcriptional regulator GlxA family with amidase domain